MNLIIQDPVKLVILPVRAAMDHHQRIVLLVLQGMISTEQNVISVHTAIAMNVGQQSV